MGNIRLGDVKKITQDHTVIKGQSSFLGCIAGVFSILSSNSLEAGLFLGPFSLYFLFKYVYF